MRKALRLRKAKASLTWKFGHIIIPYSTILLLIIKSAQQQPVNTLIAHTTTHRVEIEIDGIDIIFKNPDSLNSLNTCDSRSWSSEGKLSFISSLMHEFNSQIWICYRRTPNSNKFSLHLRHSFMWIIKDDISIFIKKCFKSRHAIAEFSGERRKTNR